MENASKALLMAGGVILAILIIGVLIFARSKIIDYFNNDDELTNIEDVAKFNLQFTNYERDNVLGYEIISIANKVQDYNMRYSSAADAKNDKKYNPIELDIIMNGKVSSLAYGDTTLLFTSNRYQQTAVTNAFSNILNVLKDYETDYGKENLQNLSKNITSVFLDPNSWTGELYSTPYAILMAKKEAVKKFNSITNSAYAGKEIYKNYMEETKRFNANDETSINNAYNLIQNYFKNISYKYYEYTQFKKGYFKCTGIDYDTDTNRVKKMGFMFLDKFE